MSERGALERGAQRPVELEHSSALRASLALHFTPLPLPYPPPLQIADWYGHKSCVAAMEPHLPVSVVISSGSALATPRDGQQGVTSGGGSGMGGGSSYTAATSLTLHSSATPFSPRITVAPHAPLMSSGGASSGGTGMRVGEARVAGGGGGGGGIGIGSAGASGEAAPRSHVGFSGRGGSVIGGNTTRNIDAGGVGASTSHTIMNTIIGSGGMSRPAPPPGPVPSTPRGSLTGQGGTLRVATSSSTPGNGLGGGGGGVGGGVGLGVAVRQLGVSPAAAAAAAAASLSPSPSISSPVRPRINSAGGVSYAAALTRGPGHGGQRSNMDQT